MSKMKFSFPITGGPPLMELMLAHYDPYPLGQDEHCREVEFKLGGEAHKSVLDCTEVYVQILGTRKRQPKSIQFTFVGTFTDYRNGAKRRVSGKFDVQSRKGSISFSEIIN